MKWEELNGDRFAEAVEECQGVCLLPLSVIERHGHHLPVGTDMYIGGEVCRRAALLEPAIVFPDYIFTQIPEAKHVVGTIAIDGDLMMRLLDNVCREIARNGLKKIVLVNAHGGNDGLIHVFNMFQLYSPRDYVVYVVQPHSLVFGEGVQVPWDPSDGEHAGPGETSLMQVIRPDLVDLEKVPKDDEAQPRNRLKALQEAGVQTGMWWYADYPTHYAGDANAASAEVGDRLLAAMVGALARAVRGIKEDTTTKQLQDEFFADSEKPRA
ncbi:MAG: creatinine amidohydrolase [Chloroflexia bacterium]|nr:creatinine amidohydrolase [Chloroflexia bacterium]